MLEFSGSVLLHNCTLITLRALLNNYKTKSMYLKTSIMWNKYFNDVLIHWMCVSQIIISFFVFIYQFYEQCMQWYYCCLSGYKIKLQDLKIVYILLWKNNYFCNWKKLKNFLYFSVFPFFNHAFRTILEYAI